MFSFPPFAGWVKRIIIACTAILHSGARVARGVSASTSSWVAEWFALIPVFVMKGEIWQLVTYSLLHASFSHLFFNMLTLWFIGAYLERDWGPRRFIECYTFCVVGAALVTIAVSYTHFLGMDPQGGHGRRIRRHFRTADGLRHSLCRTGNVLVPTAVLGSRRNTWWGSGSIVAIVAVLDPKQGGVAVFAHLGGLFFGFLWVKFMPKRGLSYAASERYFSVRNSYYRWKRRRAAKKFEVYMRDHDRKVSFDEHGNYIPPDDDKTNGGEIWMGELGVSLLGTSAKCRPTARSK